MSHPSPHIWSWLALHTRHFFPLSHFQGVPSHFEYYCDVCYVCSVFIIKQSLEYPLLLPLSLDAVFVT